MSRFKFRAAWCHAASLKPDRLEVEDFVRTQADKGFSVLFVNLKDGGGRVFWKSELHPAPSEFDYAEAFTNSCAKYGLEFHAWFMDFFEGPEGAAFLAHPEWAALNAAGHPTQHERLRGKRYGNVWMCPARRPGYTDQWLIPLYVEFAQRYSPISLHHDYVRYPGDLVPDQYCFCDYCLDEIPRHCTFVHEAYAEELFLHEVYDREYLEAHWEPSPRVLPPDYDKWPRKSKSNFLLDGGFFRGGRADLDYFFYQYRKTAIEEFCRECADAVRQANVNVKLSGAFFKNPVHSGRFIGQDWRNFSPYCEICIPMNYRDHFPGSFDQYEGLLSETIQKQLGWARDFERLWIGVALWSLIRNAEDPTLRHEYVQRTANVVAASGVEGIVWFCSEDAEKFGIKDFGF